MYSTPKDAGQLALERNAYSLLGFYPEYQAARVGADCMLTPSAPMFDLRDEAACIQAAEAVQKIHRAGVIHGDIKPVHIRVLNGSVFLIDFGSSQTRVLALCAGYTSIFASVDLLVLKTVHFLDDYEALFVSALLCNFPKMIPRAPTNKHSVKAWLSWKLSLMESVASYKTEDAYLAFLISTLSTIWSMPRNTSWNPDRNHVSILQGNRTTMDEHRAFLWDGFRAERKLADDSETFAVSQQPNSTMTGFMVYRVRTTGSNTICEFEHLFEQYEWRPLQVLLVVQKVVIDCSTFSPACPRQQLDIMQSKKSLAMTVLLASSRVEISAQQLITPDAYNSSTLEQEHLKEALVMKEAELARERARLEQAQKEAQERQAEIAALRAKIQDLQSTVLR